MNNKNNDELDSSINKRKFFHLQINKNDSSLKKFFLVLFSYIDTLIVLNLFFIVFSLGIITFGPTLLSISESIIKITNNKGNKIYSSFFKSFKNYFKLQYIIFGIAFLLIIGGTTYLSFFFFQNLFDHQYLIVPWILMIFLVLFIIDASSSYILFTIRSKLDNITCLTNGIKLAAGSIKHSLFCSLSFIILFITPLIFIERTFILFIVIEFTLTILACLLSTYSLVDKYIIYQVNEEEELQKVDKKEFKIESDYVVSKKESKEIVSDENHYDYSDSDDELPI